MRTITTAELSFIGGGDAGSDGYFDQFLSAGIVDTGKKQMPGLTDAGSGCTQNGNSVSCSSLNTVTVTGSSSSSGGDSSWSSGLTIAGTAGALTYAGRVIGAIPTPWTKAAGAGLQIGALGVTLLGAAFVAYSNI